MHFIKKIQDIYVGLAFAGLLLVFILPFAEYIDHFLLASPWAPIWTMGLGVLATVFYPGSDRWTPARYLFALSIFDCLLYVWFFFSTQGVTPR